LIERLRQPPAAAALMLHFLLLRMLMMMPLSAPCHAAIRYLLFYFAACHVAATMMSFS